MRRNRLRLERLGTAVAAAVLALTASIGTASAEGAPSSARSGFVDGSAFVAIAGENAVSVEVNLQGALLKALARSDAELTALVEGLESIHAVILTLEDDALTERLRAKVRDTQRDLAERGWQRLGLVQGAGEQIQVLVLNDEEKISGLVVMIVDENEKQMVFANVAGVIDLARIEQIGDSMELPGLSVLEPPPADD
jgi:hypothetical protein